MPITSEQRGSDSPYVSRVWRGQAFGVSRMTSVATSNWELVFWDEHGVPHAAARGPETTATAWRLTDTATYGDGVLVTVHRRAR